MRAATFVLPRCSGYENEHGDFTMSARFIHMSFSVFERRPLLAALIVYWIAIAAATLTLAFAVRPDTTCERGAHLPYLAMLAPTGSPAIMAGTA